jgi:hypothetical protein
MRWKSWQEEGGIGGPFQTGCRIGMKMTERPTLTAEVRLIEFPYFLSETWRKIGRKGNALGQVFGMTAALGRQAFQRPETGSPWERGLKGVKEKMERERRRGKRTSPSRG